MTAIMAVQPPNFCVLYTASLLAIACTGSASIIERGQATTVSSNEYLGSLLAASRLTTDATYRLDIRNDSDVVLGFLDASSRLRPTFDPSFAFAHIDAASLCGEYKSCFSRQFVGTCGRVASSG